MHGMIGRMHSPESAPSSTAPESTLPQSALETARRLPYARLADSVADLLTDPDVVVPPRLVQALPGGGTLFVMPAHDRSVAMTKLITFTPGNAARAMPTIQGDVVVFDGVTGRRLAVLDGPTVTARRTAAVSLLAARLLAPQPQGRLLVVGAGVQGRAHVEAFAAGLGTTEVWVASRSPASAHALVDHASALGLKARVVLDPNQAMAECPVVVTCTPAQGVVLSARPERGQFVAAVGAFTPAMVELDPRFCRHVAEAGQVVVDTDLAHHEAGDLIQAGLDPARFPTLQSVVRGYKVDRRGPVLFKSCGWAGWDLAAARLAVA